MLIFILYFTLTKNHKQRALNCEKDFFNLMNYTIYYLEFMVVRHGLLVFILPWVKDPMKFRNYVYWGYAVIDSFFITALTIWGSMTLFRKDIMLCRKEQKEMLRWWNLCLMSMMFGWFYSALLLIAVPSMCIVAIFTCYYQQQMRHLGRQNDAKLRIPFAKNLIKALSNKKFVKSKRTADTCVICME